MYNAVTILIISPTLFGLTFRELSYALPAIERNKRKKQGPTSKKRYGRSPKTKVAAVK